MALRADVHVYAFGSGARGELFTAGADGLDFLVFGMCISFQLQSPPLNIFYIISVRDNIHQVG